MISQDALLASYVLGQEKPLITDLDNKFENKCEKVFDSNLKIDKLKPRKVFMKDLYKNSLTNSFDIDDFDPD